MKARSKGFLPKFDQTLRQISVSYRIAVKFLKSLRKKFDWKRKRDERYSLNLRRSLWTIDPRIFDEYGKIGLENARTHMDALLDLLNAYKIRLWVVVSPWPDQIYYRDLNSKQVLFWREWCEARGVAFIDYFPYFINEKKREEAIEEYFIPRDAHWNEQGHHLAAEIFLQHWREAA